MKPLTRFSPYLPRPVEVVDKVLLNDKSVLLSLQPDGSKILAHRPGQFLMVSVMGVGEAPFAIASAPGSDVYEIVVQNVGQVSRALHALEPGAKIGCRGPLGKPFPLDAFAGRDALLVCGGLGYAPLRPLLLELLARRDEFGRIMLLAGFKSRADQIFAQELAELESRQDLEIFLTLDKPEPGWTGRTGLVPGLLAEAAPDPARTTVAVVGPPPMLPHVVNACRDLGISDQSVFLSLERRMHCGLGKCGHCQVNNVNVCTDGPVFRLDSLTSLDEVMEAPAPRD